MKRIGVYYCHRGSELLATNPDTFNEAVSKLCVGVGGRERLR